MPASDRLIYRLKSKPGYLNAREYSDSDLRRVPTDTVYLDLENARISDDGIGMLPDLPRLRCIDLDSTGVSDRSMERIAQFAGLEEIWIETTAVTDKGLLMLRQLSALKFISILDCHISDQAVEELLQANPGVLVH